MNQNQEKIKFEPVADFSVNKVETDFEIVVHLFPMCITKIHENSEV